MKLSKLVQAPGKLMGLVGGINYLRISRDLHALLICQGLARVLAAKQQVQGRSGRIKAAFLGNSQFILRQSEAIADFGFELSFFAGDPADTLRVSRKAEELDPSLYDCVLLAEDNKAVEDAMFQSLSRKGIKPIRLRALVEAHMATMKEMKAGSVTTCLNPHKQAVIAAAIELSDPAGVVVECGVYMGGTTIQIALMQKHLKIQRRIFALDTFEGMPEPTAGDSGGGFVYTAGMFADNRKSMVEKFYRRAGVQDQISVAQGLCQDTLPPITAQNPVIAFALLDTDQYAGTKGGLDAIGPILGKDGMIVIDDTTVHGVNTAIEQTLEQMPQLARAPVVTNFDLVLRR